MKSKDIYCWFCYCLLFFAALRLCGQNVPTFPTTLYFLNGVTNEPLKAVDVKVSGQLSTGEIFNENPDGTPNDDYETEAYPVGSVLEIVVKKAGYQRQKVRHTVDLNPSANRIDVRLLPIAIDTVGMVIEGDLTCIEDGIRKVVDKESVRIYTLNGVINVDVDQNGFFHIQLSEKDIAGKESLQVRAAYAGNRFEPQDIFVSTKEHYKLANFQLIPKTELVTLEVDVKDSLVGNPIANAHVRIYQAGRLIAEGATTEHGYYKTESRFSKLYDGIEVQVFKEGYGAFVKRCLPDQRSVEFDLIAQVITVHGMVKNVRKNILPMQIFLDDSLYKELSTNEEGEWHIQLPREAMYGHDILKILAKDHGTFGFEKKSIADISQANTVEFPEINPRARAGKWQTQINLGIGAAVDQLSKNCTTVSPTADFCLGIRYIPGLMIGIGGSQLRIRYSDSILALNKTRLFYRDTILKRSFLNLTLRYYLSPHPLPWIKFMVGTSLSFGSQSAMAGIQLSIARNMKIEFAGSYLWSKWEKPVFDFNFFGPATRRLVSNIPIDRKLLSVTLIKKISWKRN